MNALGKKINRIARAILRIKTTNRLGDGIRAAAVIALSDEFQLFQRARRVAADAGFPMPPWIEKKQKRARALARAQTGASRSNKLRAKAKAMHAPQPQPV
jgi:hypothetical protein